MTASKLFSASAAFRLLLHRAHKTIAASALLAALICAPVCAQKVQTNYDRSADFSRYKRYTWGKNFLITRQLPEDQARIDKAIVNAIDRHLQAKGFVRDDEMPDFFVVYKAGGLTDVKMGAVLDISSPWGTAWPTGTSTGMDIPGTGSVDFWTGIMGNIQIVVADEQSHNAVWTSLTSKKFTDPKKAMKNLDKEVDQLIKKGLKDFPPKAKGK